MSSIPVLSTTIPPSTDIDAFVTSFIPLTTTFPSVSGCNSAFWLSTYSTYNWLVAYEPSYGLSANTKLTCLPPALTPWWEQDYSSTYTKIGPVVCPAAYSTVWTSTISSYSGITVACCPTGYTFQGLSIVGTIGECASPVSAGQVLTYARNISSTVITTVTTALTTSSQVWAVQVNGFLPLQATTSATSASQTAPSPSATSAAAQVHTGMPTSTKIAIGVGVPLGLLVLASMFAMAYFLGSHRRRRRQQPRSMVHEIYPESEGKPERISLMKMNNGR